VSQHKWYSRHVSDDQAASTSEASRVLSRKIVVGLAGILAVIAFVTGDARYVNKEVVAKESVSEKVLLGCKVIKTFRGGQLQRPIPIGTSLTAESCTREIQYLSNPNAYLKMSYKVQGNLQDVVRTVPRRDWLAEFGVRGVRSIIGAVFGAVLAYLLITVRYKRQEILHALSSLGRVSQTHSHQIQSTITTTGGTAMTSESGKTPPQSLSFGESQDRTQYQGEKTKDDTKWLGRFGMWKYVPNRYQAFVASIVSAFLYYNVFQILFSPTDAGNYACGSLFRPILEDEFRDDPVGWIWNIVFFGDPTDARCPRTMEGLLFEFFASFAALLICGLVLRRSIKRAQQ